MIQEKRRVPFGVSVRTRSKHNKICKNKFAIRESAFRLRRDIVKKLIAEKIHHDEDKQIAMVKTLK